ncbi:DUF3095 domain-containing protein [Prosthecomicrobium sp. N25]|uniref:DUF3095 domain-containing protein n=1 Tax=Prosthecomicrobium sp. N25 TaxID=3129254 RepID=UPI0030782766
MRRSGFYGGIAAFDRFESLGEPRNYTPLPAGWVLGLSDIVNSTEAATQGRYKAVNMAGAALIAALQNVSDEDLPFVFGGDGAVVALPGHLRPRAEGAIAAVEVWVAEELGLQLRGAVVPLEDIRQAGHDVLVGRYRASTHVSYAMFAGGGASWAEAQMKLGRFAVPPAPPGTRPDLTGLSCRWSPLKSRSGVILSIIAVPAAGADFPRYLDLVRDIADLCHGAIADGNPVSVEGLALGYPAWAIGAEVRTRAKGRLAAWLKANFEVAVVNLLKVLPGSVGGFELLPYKADTAANSDFRKFDDGLKMTVDVSPALADRIEARLAEGARLGLCKYGVQRQDEALITCLVPTARQRDHMHFIDGAAGGYALAAARLKGRLSHRS